MLKSKFFKLIFPAFLFGLYEGDPDSGGGGAATAPAPKGTPQPENFSREYVQELRHESASYRTKAQENEKKAQEAEARAAQAAKEADDKVAAANSAANERIIRAELKASALKAGMVDLDGLKLADLSTVKLADDGTVEGADELMEALKKDKPYLFGTQSSTSTSQNPPPAKKPETKHASEMSADEYKAARAAALK